MRSHPGRRRLAGLATGLLLAGSCFAPAALSQGNPHGVSVGQAKKLAAAAPGTLPPGQAKKQAAASNPGGGAGSHVTPPGQAKKLAAAPVAPPGQAKKLSGAGHAVSHGASHKISPGKAKKTAAAARAVTTSTPAKVSPGKAKKTAQTPVAPAPTPTPVTPAATGITPTSTAPAPAASQPSSGPAARRASTQRRSSRKSRAARRAATRARQAAAAQRARAAFTRSALGTVGSPTAGGTTLGRSSLGRHAVAVPARPAAHSPASTGPLPALSNILPVALPVPDWSKPIIVILLLLCLLLGLRVWLSSRRAHRLDSQRRRLTADLASLQPALVPDIPDRFGRLAVSVAYRPADGPAAGGDFYDVFALQGGRVAMMVGDVSGHGRDALTRAAHMRYMLRAYVETGLDPRSALKLAGRVLGADPDALFATVAVAVYDAETATLTYGSAGHPPPVLLGPGAHEPLSNCASPALGWGAPTGRRQTTVPFSEGARAVFFTDGVTEVRTSDGLLGRERLTEIVAETNPSRAAADLLEEVQGEASSIRDDMAACIVEATAGSAVSEHRIDEFEVEPRHLQSGQGERFLAACGVPHAEARAVLAQAAEIAAETGSALLRAEVAGQIATATALRSGPVSLAIPASLTPEAGASSRTRVTDPTGPAIALG
jgi:serine phosphatase RsbU (regulator of sigma subunit)